MAEGREGKIMTSEWIEVVNDEDINSLSRKKQKEFWTFIKQYYSITGI